jgi:hypothetical protein
MRLASLPRRAVLASVLSVSLIGGGLAVAYAADATAGCSFTDPAGDSTLGAPMSGDDDLDITAVGLSSDSSALTAAIKVVALTAFGPANYPGDAFEYAFTLNKKAFLLGAKRDLNPDPTSSDAVTVTPYVKVDGTAGTAASLKPVFDVKASTFSISISTADLAKLAGAPVDGAVLSALGATSYANFTATERSADTAAPKAATTTYVAGSSACSAAAAPAPSGSATPAPSGSPSSATATATITISAPSRIQTSDPEPVTATLKDGSGKPMSGKRITAQVGAGKAVAGTTNSSGQVKLQPVVIDKAGTRALVVRYAGASDGSGKAEKRQSITVVAEVSKIATKTSGTGNPRTFTITLTDDDAVRHPYSGAALTVSYSGRTVTVKTNSAGQASLQIRSGTHVDITYAGRSGYVQPATARTTV